MDLSHISINRIVEAKMASDHNYRNKIESSGRPVLSRARNLTDGQLMEHLRSRGVAVDRQGFEGLVLGFSSAEEMARSLIKRSQLKPRDWDSDWIWMSLAVLWERWLPAQPSYEMIDEQMQDGYKKEANGDDCGAARVWLDVWSNLLGTIDAQGLKSIDEVDSRFRGTEFVFNWVQDLETTLWNAGLEEKKYFEEGIRFCEEFLTRFSGQDPLVTENVRRAMGSFHASRGHFATVDSFFRRWLDEDPKWGWGWIGWSDCYQLEKGPGDPSRAEGYLREGLAVPGIRDAIDILDRLEMLYTKLHRDRDAEEVRRTLQDMDSPTHSMEMGQASNVLRVKSAFDFRNEGLPLDQLDSLQEHVPRDGPITSGNRIKAGRNDPCPCGSNKKFKKCCGR